MERIRKAIENGDLEFAKLKIMEIEAKLAEESSLYSQSILKGQLTELKELYFDRKELVLPFTKPSTKETVEVLNTFDGSDKNPIFKNLSHFRIKEIQCNDATIENCNFIDSEKISCQGTVHIMNVHDSHIICHTTHLRISNCSKIKLEAFCVTGVFLQNSSDIEIIQIDEPGNNCSKVFDFNSPLRNKNYKFLKPATEPSNCS